MKLFVAGCSFSDFAGVDKTYGHYLSELMNVEYIHEGSGCGSNFRIWRKITNYIMSGELTPDDVLVIQYTEKARREFFTNCQLLPEHENMEPKNTIYEYYKDGRIIKFKTDLAGLPVLTKKENLFYNLYQEHFLDIDYVEDEFQYHNFMFQNMLKHLNIKVVFLVTHYLEGRENNFISYYQERLIDQSHLLNENEQYRLNGIDYGHLSPEGHIHLSSVLHEHIKKLGYI